MSNEQLTISQLIFFFTLFNIIRRKS